MWSSRASYLGTLDYSICLVKLARLTRTLRTAPETSEYEYASRSRPEYNHRGVRIYYTTPTSRLASARECIQGHRRKSCKQPRSRPWKTLRGCATSSPAKPVVHANFGRSSSLPLNLAHNLHKFGHLCGEFSKDGFLPIQYGYVKIVLSYLFGCHSVNPNPAFTAHCLRA
jgi:hypothetical protein